MNKLINNIKKKIKESEKRTLENFSEEEEDITARLLENIKRDFEEINSKEYSIETKIFRRKGKNSEEHQFGADILIILDVKDFDNNLKKFF